MLSVNAEGDASLKITFVKFLHFVKYEVIYRVCVVIVILIVIVLSDDLQNIPSVSAFSAYCQNATYTVFHKNKNGNQIQPILTTVNFNYTKIA